MHTTSPAFKDNARAALADAALQKALPKARTGFVAKRARAVAALPEFEALREEGREIKNHVLAHLDAYLETYARAVEATGGVVHWCETAEDARRTVVEICRAAGARCASLSLPRTS